MTPKVLFGFSRLPARLANIENAPAQAWTEGLITAIAVSTAVIVVAMIALVMGMASP